MEQFGSPEIDLYDQIEWWTESIEQEKRLIISHTQEKLWNLQFDYLSSPEWVDMYGNVV